MTELAARATRLGPAFDLLAGYREGGFFLERSGLGLATSGEVDRVAAEAGPERILRLSRSILEALASIEAEPGSPSAAAVASIPFDDRQPAEAVLPRRATMRLDAGETWQVEIAPRGETPHAGERERWAGRTLPHDAFEEIQLRPDPEPDEYAAAVGRATERIRSGELRKVVLARTMLVNADRTLDPKQLLWRLRAVDADCYAFAAPQPNAVTGSVSLEASASRIERDRRRMRSGPASAATRSTSPLVASPSPERSRKKPPSRYPASRSNAGPSRVARAASPVTSPTSTAASERHRRVPRSIWATPPPSGVRSTCSNPASPSISRSRSGSGR